MLYDSWGGNNDQDNSYVSMDKELKQSRGRHVFKSEADK